MKVFGKILLFLGGFVAGAICVAAFTAGSTQELHADADEFFRNKQLYDELDTEDLRLLMQRFALQDEPKSYMAAAAIRDMIEQRMHTFD
jgi:hypothetical protein